MSQDKKPQRVRDNANDVAQDSKSSAGPEKMAQEIDAKDQWDKVASEPGFQRGTQGGYKGSYDETKVQQIQDKDVNPDEDRKVQENATTSDLTANRSGGDGKKAPMAGNDRLTEAKE